MANIFKTKTLVGRSGIFSHEVIAPNLVYNTGNQTILGNKTFIDNIEVQGTGIFNSVDLSNISEFQFSGVTMNLVDTNVYVSGGWIYISGNQVLTGSSSLSTLNLNNVVYTTGNQTIEGVKDFNNIINVSGIQFDILTTTQTPVHQEGLLYYSDDTKTLNLDVDVAGLELPIGQENWLRAKNLTNSTITPGTVVYINGAQGNTPLVQRSIATGDSTSARTVAIAAHSISNNSKGYFTTFGIVEGINTSAYSVGQTLYLSPQVSGGLTGVKPQAPNHTVRIGEVLDQGNNGSVFVNIQNGFEIEELHDVRIINPSNNNGIVYNSASGLWLNIPVALANEVVYITGNQIISGNKTFINNQVFSGNINVSGTGLFAALDVTNIDGISLSGVDISIVNGTVTSNYPINASTVNAINLVYNSGSQIISGTKTFTLRPNVNGSGVLLVGEAAGLPPNILFTSGQQLISGSKSFSNTVSFSGVTTFSSNTIFSGTVIDIIDTALNLSGAGDMTFTSTNINFINSPVFISGTNLRVSGDVLANNLVYNTGNQTINGNLSANNLVYTTNNQIISGNKNFKSNVDVQSLFQKNPYSYFDSIKTGRITILSGIGPFERRVYSGNLGVLNDPNETLVIFTTTGVVASKNDLLVKIRNAATTTNPFYGSHFENLVGGNVNRHFMRTMNGGGFPIIAEDSFFNNLISRQNNNPANYLYVSKDYTKAYTNNRLDTFSAFISGNGQFAQNGTALPLTFNITGVNYGDIQNQFGTGWLIGMYAGPLGPRGMPFGVRSANNSQNNNTGCLLMFESAWLSDGIDNESWLNMAFRNYGPSGIGNVGGVANPTGLTLNIIAMD